MNRVLDELAQSESYDGVKLSALGADRIQDALIDLKSKEVYLKAVADGELAEAALSSDGRALREFALAASTSASEWFEAQPLTRALRAELRESSGEVGRPLSGEMITEGWIPPRDYELWIVDARSDLSGAPVTVESDEFAEALGLASELLTGSGRADISGVYQDERQEVCRVYADGSVADIRPARAQVLEAAKLVSGKRERGSRREVIAVLSERDYPNHVIAAALRELEDRGELPARDERRFSAKD